MWVIVRRDHRSVVSSTKHTVSIRNLVRSRHPQRRVKYFLICLRITRFFKRVLVYRYINPLTPVHHLPYNWGPDRPKCRGQAGHPNENRRKPVTQNGTVGCLVQTIRILHETCVGHHNDTMGRRNITVLSCFSNSYPG